MENIDNRNKDEEEEEQAGLSFTQKALILGSWIVGGILSLASDHPADGVVLAAGVTTVVVGYSAADRAFEKSRQVAI